MIGKNYSNKLIAIICLVSIALNILLLGYVLGNKAGTFRWEHKDKHSIFEKRVKRLIRDLPPSTQEKCKKTIRDYTPNLEKNFHEKLRDLNHRLAEAITGEKVDVEAAQQVFADIRTTFDQTHMKFQQGLLKALQGLSPEERKRVANALEEHRKPH